MTIVLLWAWGVAERTGHDKPKEKGPVRPESISRHREWRPEHLQISQGRNGLLAE